MNHGRELAEYNENYAWVPQLTSGHESSQGYPTLKEGVSMLEAWEREFGGRFVKKTNVGQSLEGRPIDAYVITNHT